MKIVNRTKRNLRIDLYSLNVGEEPDHLVERIDGYKEVGDYKVLDTQFPVDVIEIIELTEEKKEIKINEKKLKAFLSKWVNSPPDEEVDFQMNEELNRVFEGD